jgi:hypothetical protein
MQASLTGPASPHLPRFSFLLFQSQQVNGDRFWRSASVCPRCAFAVLRCCLVPQRSSCRRSPRPPSYSRSCSARTPSAFFSPTAARPIRGPKDLAAVCRGKDFLDGSSLLELCRETGAAFAKCQNEPKCSGASLSQNMASRTVNRMMRSSGSDCPWEDMCSQKAPLGARNSLSSPIDTAIVW